MKDFRGMEKYFTALREKLEYGVYHVVQELDIEAYISKEPLHFCSRLQGAYRTLAPGGHWGGLFDCGWFHFQGQVPEPVKDMHTAVLVDVSAEGLLVDEKGDPVQGLTSATSRNEFPLGLWGKRTIEMQDCSKDGSRVDFWIDFTCCDVEGQYRNNGRVKEACIAVIDDVCRDAFYDWSVCQSLFVGLCENGDPYGETVGEILLEAAKVLEASLPDVIREWKDDFQEGGQKAEGKSFQANSNGKKTEMPDADTEQLMKGRDDYAGDRVQNSRQRQEGTQQEGMEQECGKEDRLGLDASSERLSMVPDLETNHTLQCQRTLDSRTLARVRSILERILKEQNTGFTMRYSSMGHSHLDLLFLWPERETYRKCARTLSTVMKMMDRYEDYKFCLSQAPVYRWMKEKYPALYCRLKQRIQEKRIEVTGAFWVECDTNLPGGESLVRQLLYGKRFFREEFGLDMKVGFLPDVFGYSAALPQLFVKSGVPYFTTNKLSMNDTNRFPRYTFWWYGLDGSRVLTHMLPENSYTSAAVPQMAIYGEYHNTDKDVCPEGIQLYGLGDGGGGPGYEHMERRKRTRNLKGCPPFQDEFLVDFFQRIEKNGDRYRDWRGELYFERHQGTYTSIAKQKKWNRKLEQALHQVEWLASLAQAGSGEEYPKEWLLECWQDVMLYQFHDCLPGSSIQTVYEETQARYEEMYAQALERIAGLEDKLASRMDISGMDMPAIVCNPTSFYREERLEAGGKERTVCMAPYEIRALDMAETRPFSVQEADGLILENDLVKMEFSKEGTVVRLLDKIRDRDLLPPGQEGNVLNLYPDELTHWDINKEYLNALPERAELISINKTVEGLCQKLHLAFRTGERSRIRQTVVMTADSARVDFVTQVDWQEEYRMLRTAWPVDVAALEAQCDIQFGHIGRPVHRNTSWDEAKFEVCAHKWVDISDKSGGLALLNDCKYGYKVWDGILDLCLLRSQNCPCEKGDIGIHEFTYAVYPHQGDVWDGGVVRQGYLLNTPLLVKELETAFAPAAEKRPVNYRFVEMDTSSVVLETVKRAEDRDGYILRFYEAAGGRTEAGIRLNGFEAVCLCSILEEPEPDDPDFEKTPEGAKIRFHAYEIQSLLVRRKDG